MRVKVISEISLSRGVISAGKIIDIAPALLERLQYKVAPLPQVGENEDVPVNFKHKCEAGDCWCSAKLPDNNWPEECKRIQCEHFQP
jgi:hypothetical protein